MFQQLSNAEDEIIYDDFKDDFPYKLVSDNNWKFLWSYLETDKHPIAYLILQRFRIRNRILNNINNKKET